jgi:hypothetical protein
VNALEASLFAGLVAIGATLAIERWGGVVGGFVATLPSTILPATWGLWSSVGPSGYREAMTAVPFGMLVNAMFLHLWRVVPRNLPPHIQKRLAWTLALALTGWFVLALFSLLLLSLVRSAAPQALLPFALSIAAAAWIFGVIACLDGAPAPGGTRAVRPAVILTRGVLAAAAVGGAIHLGSLGLGIASGLCSTFPAIFLTTMVSLWLAQGEAVPTGAIGPMMLGSTSVSVYALLTCATFPAFGVARGSALAWICAVSAVAAPSFVWLRRRHAARSVSP